MPALFTDHPFLSLGAAAFVCGVALFYLVMRRTQKHRAANPE